MEYYFTNDDLNEIDSIKKIHVKYEKLKSNKDNVLSLYYALIHLNKIDWAEELILRACQDFNDRLWPFINYLYIVAIKEDYRESAKLSIQIIKAYKNFDQVRKNDQIVFIYHLINLAYENKHEAAISTYESLAARIEPYIRKIILSQKEFLPLSKEHFRDRIVALTQQKSDSPYVCQRYSEIPLTDFQFLRSRKILFILRDHTELRPGSRKSETHDIFSTSAEIEKINFKLFASDLLTHYHPLLNDNNDKKKEIIEGVKSELSRLERLIDEWQPDYVYFDNCLGQDCLELVECTYESIKKLKAKYGFKLITFYMDSWTEIQRMAMERMNSLTDVFHQTHVSARATLKEGIENKTFYFPYPYTEEIFYDASVEKDTFAGFIGSIFSTRMIWVKKMEHDKLDVHVRRSQQSASEKLMSMRTYGQEISRYKVQLSFSARSINSYSVITSRVWEGILARSLIMEEHSMETEDYLIPFAHYIPFQNYAQLKAYLGYLKEDPELITMVCDNALNFVKDNYSGRHFWQGLMSLADGSD